MKQSSLSPIFAGLVAGAVALAHAASPPIPPQVAEGWDWSLPPGCKPVESSGYITWGDRRFHPSVTVRGLMLTWERLNPEPGRYDWDWVREEIRKNRAMGLRTGLHLKGVERTAVPGWIIDKFHPVVLDVPPLQEGQPWRIQIVPPWQPEVDRAFHEFLRAFAQTGIAQEPDVVYGYIHGISASRGEEMFIRNIDLELWQQTSGLMPEQFASWLQRRIDGMCEVFRGVEHKLALMWDGPLGPSEDFRAATAGLYQDAIRKGAGIRGGGIDFMHGLFEAPAWGSSVNAEGYALVDDDHPTIRENRFRGDENEEYGRHWEWRFGPVADHAYRHRICCLRGLQMRQNYQLVAPTTLTLNPELNEYVRITQGFRRENSPDAWAYLRECNWRSGRVKNIERWLVQRDAPGSQSVPDAPVERCRLPSEQRGGTGNVQDSDARRTDLARKQDGLLFGLDRVFWNQPGPATIKVTYTDRSPASWHLRYTDGAGLETRTASVRNVGDGKRKTATFRLPVLAAAGAFPNDATFHAWLNAQNIPGGELVRNGNFAQGLASWPASPFYQTVPDPANPSRTVLEYRHAPDDDTPHLDQLVDLQPGVLYELSAVVRSEGQGLRPGVRVGRMDWSTTLYLEGGKTGEWETLAGSFQAAAGEKARVQLFGQGRGNKAPGQTGRTLFREVSLRPVAPEELRRKYQMDFRLETEGPGDLQVTLVRIIKGMDSP